MVFLDEPTTGLDVEARHALWQGIRAYHADGGTVLLTSHYLEEIEALARRVVVLHRGRVIADAPLTDVRGLIGLKRVSLTCATLPALPGVAGIEHDGDRTHLLTADADKLVRDLTASGTKYGLIETLRAPVSFLVITLMPLAVMVFFIVPNLGDNPAAMIGATATMVVFATLLACVGQFSATVAVMRESPWGAYLRTLPAGLTPAAFGHLLTGMVVVLAAIVPIVVVGVLSAGGGVPAARVPTAVAALLVAVVVFTLLGLAIGYTMSVRATVVANSVPVLALAVGGGMFADPANLPGPIAAIAPYLPTRGATDLVLAALIDHPLDPTSLVMLAIWTAGLGALTVWGYRRDEGRRFR